MNPVRRCLIKNILTTAPVMARFIVSLALWTSCCSMLAIAVALAQEQENEPSNASLTSLDRAEPTYPSEELLPQSVRNFIWNMEESALYRIEILIFRWAKPQFDDELIYPSPDLKQDARLLTLTTASNLRPLNLDWDIQLPGPINQIPWPDTPELLESLASQRAILPQLPAILVEQHEICTFHAQPRIPFKAMHPASQTLSCLRADQLPFAIASQAEHERKHTQEVPRASTSQNLFFQSSTPVDKSSESSSYAVQKLLATCDNCSTESTAVKVAPEITEFLWPPLISYDFFKQLNLQKVTPLLANQAKGLTRSTDTQVLVHWSWVQPLHLNKDSPRVLIHLPQHEAHPELQGTFWGWKQRFLHLQMDLSLLDWQSAADFEYPSATSDPRAIAPEPSEHVPEHTNRLDPVDLAAAEPLPHGTNYLTLKAEWQRTLASMNWLQKLNTHQPQSSRWFHWLELAPPPELELTPPSDPDPTQPIATALSEDSEQSWNRALSEDWYQKAVRNGLSQFVTPQEAPSAQKGAQKAAQEDAPKTRPPALPHNSPTAEPQPITAQEIIRPAIKPPAIEGAVQLSPPLPDGIRWPPSYFEHFRYSKSGFTAYGRSLLSQQRLALQLQEVANRLQPLKHAVLTDRFRLNEERKVDEDEIHFFDHPAFGVIAIVQKIAPETYNELLQKSSL
ncbi:MAG: CsiV family protein [Gammaproteobacteria bacterium]